MRFGTRYCAFEKTGNPMGCGSTKTAALRIRTTGTFSFKSWTVRRSTSVPIGFTRQSASKMGSAP